MKNAGQRTVDGAVPSRRARKSNFMAAAMHPWFLAVVLMGAALILGACQKPAAKPLEIAQNDLCFRCKAPIAEKQYAAEFATKDGFVRKFDDISCMVDHAKGKVGVRNISAYFVADYGTKEWLKGEEATFVRSEKFKTPMNGGILAFKDKAKAQGLAKNYQAAVLTLNDLLGGEGK